jgi:hypothetical protein
VEREAVGGEVRVQRLDERVGLERLQVLGARRERDIVAARDQRHRVGGEHEVRIGLGARAEHRERRDRHVVRRVGRRGAERGEDRGRVAARLDARLRPRREARERARCGERGAIERREAGNDEREAHRGPL